MLTVLTCSPVVRRWSWQVWHLSLCVQRERERATRNTCLCGGAHVFCFSSANGWVGGCSLYQHMLGRGWQRQKHMPASIGRPWSMVEKDWLGLVLLCLPSLPPHARVTDTDTFWYLFFSAADAAAGEPRRLQQQAAVLQQRLSSSAGEGESECCYCASRRIELLLLCVLLSRTASLPDQVRVRLVLLLLSSKLG